MAERKPQAAERAQRSRSEEIAGILRDEILAGQYRAGERLPSERDLTTRFEAGRGAIREALKKLEQLGIASIQPGGSRVVPVEACTLDVLGPLLDLNDIPDAKLVDEVLHIFGVLMGVAARTAVEKATEEDLEQARDIIKDICSIDDDQRQYAALRRLGTFFVDVADHLVLRLIINGLRTTFMARLNSYGIHPTPDVKAYREIAKQLQQAFEQRDAVGVGDAVRRLNRMFRDSARDALSSSQTTQQRISA